MPDAPLLTSQGTTLTFGGVVLGKYLGITGAFKSPAKEIRPLSAAAVDEAGRYLPIYEQTTCDQTTTLEALVSAIDTNLVGSTAELAVVGTGWGWTLPYAYLEDFQVLAKVGDKLRTAFSFKRSLA
jgi:hypothetical protein